jgi:hypothetical protein
MSVHFVPWNTSRNMLEETRRLYDEAGTFDCIEEGDLVAVKLHVGELGNPYYVQPVFAHDIAQRVREAGGKPFLTDSNTYYHVERSNALDHMNTTLMNGFNRAPFIVADGLRGENYRIVKTSGILSEIEVSGAIAEADAMIVITHCKGHEITSFGGAIKNLAMGCTPPVGKLRQHRTIGIEIDQSKCTGCGKCKVTCPRHLPEIIEGKAHNTSPECMRCPICIENCPMKAIKFTHQENVSKALASAAKGVLSTFKESKVAYVSFAKDITQLCDCWPNPKEKVMKDLGVLAADSPVSVDAGFLSMVNYNIFNDYSHVNCMTQVEEAKTIGIKGEIKPKIINIG